MDKGSAEEEKIDALLNSSVRGCSLPSSGLRRQFSEEHQAHTPKA